MYYEKVPPPPRWCLLCLAAPWFFISCTDEDNSPDPVTVQAPLSEGEDSPILDRDFDESKVGEEEAGEHESASSVALARWNNINPDAVNTFDTASVTVENVSIYPLRIETRLECLGIGGRLATSDLGTHTVPVGESIVLDIPAAAIPIQPISGTGQIGVEISATVETPGAAGTQKLGTVPMYYQYKNGENRVSLFTGSVLKAQFGGVIDGVVGGQLQEEDLIGRIATGKGSFQEVRHSTLASKTEVKADAEAPMYAEFATITVGLHTAADFALEEQSRRELEEMIAQMEEEKP